MEDIENLKRTIEGLEKKVAIVVDKAPPPSVEFIKKIPANGYVYIAVFIFSFLFLTFYWTPPFLTTINVTKIHDPPTKNYGAILGTSFTISVLVFAGFRYKGVNL